MFEIAATMMGLVLLLAACETVPTSQVNPASVGRTTASISEMDQVMAQFTPLRFKATRVGEMRQRLKAAGYQKASSRSLKTGGRQELWRGVVKRNGQNVSRARARISTYPGSSIVQHVRVTLDDMTASFGAEMRTYLRARKNILLIDRRDTEAGKSLRYLLVSSNGQNGRNRAQAPRGALLYGLGGLRLFTNGDRRFGISLHSKC